MKRWYESYCYPLASLMASVYTTDTWTNGEKLVYHNTVKTAVHYELPCWPVIMFLVLLHVASMVSLGQKYNDSTKNTTEMPHTVSGFSSGADMAMIHMVAFSSHVLGMGIVGGAPYGCNIMPNTGDTCGAMAGNFFNHIKKLTRFINLSRICCCVVRREQQSAVDKVVAQFFGLYCGPRAKRIN